MNDNTVCAHSNYFSYKGAYANRPHYHLCELASIGQRLYGNKELNVLGGSRTGRRISYALLLAHEFKSGAELIRCLENLLELTVKLLLVGFTVRYALLPAGEDAMRPDDRPSKKNNVSFNEKKFKLMYTTMFGKIIPQRQCKQFKMTTRSSD